VVPGSHPPSSLNLMNVAPEPNKDMHGNPRHSATGTTLPSHLISESDFMTLPVAALQHVAPSNLNHNVAPSNLNHNVAPSNINPTVPTNNQNLVGGPQTSNQNLAGGPQTSNQNLAGKPQTINQNLACTNPITNEPQRTTPLSYQEVLTSHYDRTWETNKIKELERLCTLGRPLRNGTCSSPSSTHHPETLMNQNP
jgi:hypothetical protein